MWPFSEKAPPAPPAPDIRQLRIAALAKAMPMGMEFAYLSTRHRVTGHSILRMGYHHCALVPKLCTDYVDGQGVIRQLEFSYAEAQQLAEDLRTVGRPDVWP